MRQMFTMYDYSNGVASLIFIAIESVILECCLGQVGVETKNHGAVEHHPLIYNAGGVAEHVPHHVFKIIAPTPSLERDLDT